jgi:hypothetical protein
MKLENVEWRPAEKAFVLTSPYRKTHQQGGNVCFINMMCRALMIPTLFSIKGIPSFYLKPSPSEDFRADPLVAWFIYLTMLPHHGVDLKGNARESYIFGNPSVNRGGVTFFDQKVPYVSTLLIVLCPLYL